MTHDNKKKTIYYDNAILKIYDIPLFYFPKIFHPDPSVDRRSGFLPPTLVSGKNLGTGMAIPYFWNIDKDKNFTVTNRIYTEENPLFLGAYHQVFRNSYFKTDFGYTEGYKKSSLTKLAGKKSHFFSEFKTFFNRKDNYETFLKMKFQDTSDDKYLKVYKIKTDLAEYEVNKLENAIEFSHSNEDLLFDIAKKTNLDSNEFQRFITSQEAKDLLIKNTDELMGRGGFGSPTFFYNDNMFFGNDRISLLEGLLIKKIL